jgi:hypothetical protein
MTVVLFGRMLIDPFAAILTSWWKEIRHKNVLTGCAIVA